MLLTELIKEYQKKLEQNPNDFSCLLFALQIPSICSRIEIPNTPENRSSTDSCSEGKYYKPNGNVWDANIYKKWIMDHIEYFVDVYDVSTNIYSFCDNIYCLRCKMTHEGVVMTDTSKFYFTDGDKAMCIKDIIFIPIKRLCEDMFDAVVDRPLGELPIDIEITPFDKMVLPTNTYSKIYKDVESTSSSFWDNYSTSDNTLYRIYNDIIFHQPDKNGEIAEFFNNHPDDIFEIWDFISNYKSGICVDELFIHQDYDESKSIICRDYKHETDVLRLTKEQYERMLLVVKEHNAYSEKHPFDITKYIKK